MTIYRSEERWTGVARGREYVIKKEKEIVWQIDLPQVQGQEQSIRIVRIRTNSVGSSDWFTCFAVELASRDVLGELFWKPADPMPEWVTALIIDHIGMEEDI